ncbi:MAG TPA: hypothetical protein VLF66_04870, partial [Thermoanaerobaculia bacterium]|nr:hypothetical protein [Thermoanaerobaculia bacterium]
GAAFVTITRAEGKPSKGELRVEGTATTATNVSIYEGGPDSSGGACPGTKIGTATVNNDEFRFEKKNLASVPNTVCIRSSDGQIAWSPVEDKD